MTKTTTIAAMIGGLTLGAAVTAHAQTAQAEGRFHVNVSAGGQFSTHEFSPVTTFTLYGETGSLTANQTVGGGFVFDVSAGYSVWNSVSVGMGVSTFSGTGEAAALLAIPNPLFVNTPTLIEYEASSFGELSQSNVAVNFLVTWSRPISNAFGIAIFGGPSIVNVSQDLPSVTADAAALPIVISESASTGKAGTIGVDLNYRLNPRIRVGVLIRYLGGEVDLPSMPKLKVGGPQVAGGIRFRY